MNPLESLGRKIQMCSSSKKIHEDVLVALGRLNNHTFSPKLDGIRCIVSNEGGVARLYSREGNEITDRYPEIVSAFGRYRYVDSVLDGELVALQSDGTQLFSAMSQRNSQSNTRTIRLISKTIPVSYIAFDCLATNHLTGIEKGILLGICGLPLEQRLVELGRALASPLRMVDQRIQICPTTTDGLALWNQSQALGLEGIVAKRNGSRYQGGRSADWVKLKKIYRGSFLVSATAATANKTIGKIEIAVLGVAGQIIPMGSVGTGWTPQELKALVQRCQEFSAAPTTVCPVVVDVDFTGLYEDGTLKFASFVGVRTDIDWRECTYEQEGLQ